MSRVISFSGDKEFAHRLDSIIEDSGYKNRSMFLRDASLQFADVNRSGDLSTMDADSVTEGVLVIFYQHGVESKSLDIRHSHSIQVSSYNHNCLTESHTCVDTMQIRGEAGSVNDIVERLKNTKDVDRVSFVSAPLREAGCC